MTRKQKREKVREWHKQVRKFTLNQFERFLEILVNQKIEEAEAIYTQTLRQEFGFGDKRIERFKAAAQQIYDTGRESDDNQD